MEGASSGKRILYFTAQPVYRPGEKATGGGLRAYGIGEALKGRGHEVLFSEPGSGHGGGTVPFSGNRDHNVDDIADLVRDVGPDIVIFGNWGLADRARIVDVPVVVDINGSLILENYFRKGSGMFEDMLGKIRALEKVDLVLAGSASQKAYLTAWCLMAGMDPERLLIEVLPFSLPPDPPDPAPPRDPVLVMAGYRWPWLKGQAILESVAHKLEALGKGNLTVFTSTPPYYDLFSGEDSAGDSTGYLDLASLPRTRVHQPVAFPELVRSLSSSTAAMDLWETNCERELAVSSRAIVYLWCGLPVITNKDTGLSPLIRSYGAGWTLDPSDTKALNELLEEIVNRPEVLADPRKGARKLAAEHFSWDRSIKGLDRFCRAPRKIHSSSPFLELTGELGSTVRELDAVRLAVENENRSLKDRVFGLEKESALMGEASRRAKGLEVVLSGRHLRDRLRRYFFQVPVLFYLLALARAGEFLMGLRDRMGMK